MRTPRPVFLFVHSSDELYGADRMLLEMVEALPSGVRDGAEVWLPQDLEHPAAPLCDVLARRGIEVRHEPLPILRRAYRRPSDLVRLSAQSLAVARRLRQVRPSTVYCTTSATFLMAPAARLAGVPEVVGHVQEIWSGSDVRVLAPLARAAHRLLAISGPVAASIPHHLHQRTHVVTNATPDPMEWHPVPTDERPLRYLVASRWTARKGHTHAAQGVGSPGRHRAPRSARRDAPRR